MQIYRKTSKGFTPLLFKMALRLLVIFFIILIIFFVVDKIEIPSPNKVIKEDIPNEKFKVLK